MPAILIEPCRSAGEPGWLSLREALWPDGPRERHLAEMASFVADPARYVQFMAYGSPRLPVGFAEASLRSDYVNGTEGSPVAFLEGIYVAPAFRRRGIAARLVGAVAAWATSRGCRELASDVLLENRLGQAVHKALGFRETERVVFFSKKLL